MKIKPIPEGALELFGGKLRLGYMATVRPDGHLSVVPVGVVIHEGTIRISSPSDTYKVSNLRQDPHITVCIPDPDDPRRYLMVRGTADLADDTDKRFLDWLARTHMGMEDGYRGEKPEIARTVITMIPERFVWGGTNENG